MTKPIERDPIYRGRRFQTETIELCVRWYITYRLSYRDLVAMMAERGIVVSHTTIMRWVLRYVPEYESRWDRYARPVNLSWRMDETAVSVRGGLHHLYRAVDKCGKSVGSLLRADRGMDAAKEFFRKAVAANELRWPTTVNLDGNAASHRGLRLLGDEDARWKSVVVRYCRYLNNIVEQDHRVIKRRCASMLGLKSFRTAAITFAGIELANRIRKGQFSFGRARQRRSLSLKQLWDFALTQSPQSDQSRRQIPPARPLMHQNARVSSRGVSGLSDTRPRRCARKIFDGETYRFSEDLDFTLLKPEHLDADFLKETFSEIGAWIYEETGIEIPADGQEFEAMRNANARGNCYQQGCIGDCANHSSNCEDDREVTLAHLDRGPDQHSADVTSISVTRCQLLPPIQPLRVKK